VSFPQRLAKGGGLHDGSGASQLVAALTLG